MKSLIGELIGTYLLVTIGCGAVATDVIYGTLGLLGVAIIFGAGVSIGICASSRLSPSHLNPAVSIAFTVKGDINLAQLPLFLLGQFIGAFLGGLTVYFVFSSGILHFENVHEIVRGTKGSEVSAMMFGEYYPNPGFTNMNTVSTWLAMSLEAIGTFLLMFGILKLISSTISSKYLPVFIGLLVTCLILIIAPYTQAGFNPARDFSPRLIAYLMGWGKYAFTAENLGFLYVYIIGPIIGAVSSVIIFKVVKK